MQLEIDGQEYEFPAVGSFDLDEDRVFYRATGLHAEDVWMGLQDGGDLTFTSLLEREGFLAVMAQIAYKREHPELDDDTIASMIGKVNRLGLLASLMQSAVEVDADVPLKKPETNDPDASSRNSQNEKPRISKHKDKRSGKPSKPSSERQADGHETTGTSGSDGQSASDRLRRVV